MSLPHARKRRFQGALVYQNLRYERAMRLGILSISELLRQISSLGAVFLLFIR
jgi:hypothetical protein